MVEYPWYKSYDKGVPYSLEPYPRSLYSMSLQRPREKCRSIPSCIFKDRYFSYKEASRLFEVMASALIANGVKQGDRVATMLLNTPQQLIAAFGAMRAGGIYVLFNPLYNEDELVHTLTTVDAEVIIVWTCFMPVLRRYSLVRS